MSRPVVFLPNFPVCIPPALRPYIQPYGMELLPGVDPARMHQLIPPPVRTFPLHYAPPALQPQFFAPHQPSFGRSKFGPKAAGVRPPGLVPNPRLFKQAIAAIEHENMVTRSNAVSGQKSRLANRVTWPTVNNSAPKRNWSRENSFSSNNGYRSNNHKSRAHISGHFNNKRRHEHSSRNASWRRRGTSLASSSPNSSYSTNDESNSRFWSFCSNTTAPVLEGSSSPIGTCREVKEEVRGDYHEGLSYTVPKCELLTEN